MAIIEFSKIFSHLVRHDIPKTQLQSYPCNLPNPEESHKKVIHPENGFVKLYCEEYDKSDK